MDPGSWNELNAPPTGDKLYWLRTQPVDNAMNSFKFKSNSRFLVKWKETSKIYFVKKFGLFIDIMVCFQFGSITHSATWLPADSGANGNSSLLKESDAATL